MERRDGWRKIMAECSERQEMMNENETFRGGEERLKEQEERKTIGHAAFFLRGAIDFMTSTVVVHTQTKYIKVNQH